ncbi:gluzincin family metallopeptidase [Niallia nealsonii]|uniref:Metal-dependent carboxypeptidase n=1 Tax=Niallia nealsonii TaxID=115979 RepID=A0A2N0YY83_9BACI|nr:carboxypeptidase M32 [Niallia nealsonii]PKG22221.1 carboxypeptidase [Niallia nealsonii]
MATINIDILEQIQIIEHYKQTLAILSWDAKTKGPKNARSQNAKIQGTLTKELYSKQTDKKFARNIERSLEKDLSELERKQLEFHLKEYKRLSIIPVEDVHQFSVIKAAAHGNWSEAKKQNNFKLVENDLQILIDTKKRFASLSNRNLSEYDQLLDEYEPGVLTGTLDNMFDQVKQAIFPLLNSIRNASIQPDSSFLSAPFLIDNQIKLGKKLLNSIGYQFESGEVSETMHPFSTGIHTHDARLAVRFEENNIKLSSLMFLHEGGHSLYNQQISKRLDTTGLGVYTSMGLHESQSIFWEKVIGKHEGFWKNHFHLLREFGPSIYKDISFDQFYFALNEVKPSFIRYESDDVTYPLHIIIRYELEKELFSGNLKVTDLPDAWNEKYDNYLGIRPRTDSEGVLQDGHWYGGAFGYFPSYLIGFIYAAQIRQVLMREFRNFDDLINDGKLSIFLEWQKEHIHRFGKLKTSKEILGDLAIEKINEEPLIQYLTEKYKKLYKL